MDLERGTSLLTELYQVGQEPEGYIENDKSIYVRTIELLKPLRLTSEHGADCSIFTLYAINRGRNRWRDPTGKTASADLSMRHPKEK
jgi:hypothetical protein